MENRCAQRRLTLWSLMHFLRDKEFTSPETVRRLLRIVRRRLMEATSSRSTWTSLTWWTTWSMICEYTYCFTESIRWEFSCMRRPSPGSPQNRMSSPKTQIWTTCTCTWPIMPSTKQMQLFSKTSAGKRKVKTSRQSMMRTKTQMTRVDTRGLWMLFWKYSWKKVPILTRSWRESRI